MGHSRRLLRMVEAVPRQTLDPGGLFLACRRRRVAAVTLQQLQQPLRHFPLPQHYEGEHPGAGARRRSQPLKPPAEPGPGAQTAPDEVDRKSTRLNSSHVAISYAASCLNEK